MWLASRVLSLLLLTSSYLTRSPFHSSSLLLYPPLTAASTETEIAQDKAARKARLRQAIDEELIIIGIEASSA